MITLTVDDLLRLRLQAQQLIMRQSNVAQIVRTTCGIQAQEMEAAALSLRARSSGLTQADVEQARVQERSIIRTWGPRGTFHLLATEDLPWLLSLFGPVFIAANQRRRAELGLDEDTCQFSMRLICNALASKGPLTRAELVESLETHNLRIEGQARPHLLQRAALEGLICLGPDRGKEPTYVLLKDWVDQWSQISIPSHTEAMAQLTLRYLNAYGPATPEDMAAWAGLPLKWIRPAWSAIANQLQEMQIDASSVWQLKTQRMDLAALPDPEVHLLPRYDTYLLGYHKRDLIVPPQYARRVNAGGGIVHPTILLDGRVIATWHNTKQSKSRLNIAIKPFEPPLSLAILPGLEAEINDMARFLSIDEIISTPA
ncbi:hypothetical protein KSF_082950 [Reticulibacter mediterranei]|uniref:Winged helix DNA-binding domain-containing protein n=1 Tax=Reticulibacter mediterranei TaxID=2778369 RepID=A0A8J3IWR8_9CHLR|nr:winged helix DNA-binding domain-containing protein [Reticulibacter mediterranei]GHO98247.1 hypothetical protein KSF_082950 [Reticulibacter mediterranei]